MMTVPEKALRFLSNVKPLKLRFAQRMVKLESFNKLFKQLYLKTNHMKEILKLLNHILLNNKICAPSSRATSTNKMELFQNGSKSASLSNLASKSLRRNA